MSNQFRGSLQIEKSNIVVNGDAMIDIILDQCAEGEKYGVGYLWNEFLVLETRRFPFYSHDEFQLPAAPWIWPNTLAK